MLTKNDNTSYTHGQLVGQKRQGVYRLPLNQLARMRPSLRADATIERVTQRLEECLDSLRTQAESGQPASSEGSHSRRCTTHPLQRYQSRQIPVVHAIWHEMPEHTIVTKLPSSPSCAAQVLFWRLPYRLRHSTFRQLRPALAAHYDRMLHGQAGSYSLLPMLERGCLFIHIPKCAGVAVNHALFGGLGGGHLPVAHYQLVFDAAQYRGLFKFTVVRNPYDRLLSAYRFLARGGLNAQDAAWAARTLPTYDGFADFVERWLTPALAARVLHFRPQISFLRIPGRTRIEVDFLARQERVADDFARLCARLGIAPLPLEQENPSAPPATDFHAAYSHRAREIAARVHRPDLELTGCTF